MTTERMASGNEGVTFADVLDRVLDKGIVIDRRADVALVGVAVLRVDAVIVMGSFDRKIEAQPSVAAISAADEYLRAVGRAA